MELPFLFSDVHLPLTITVALQKPPEDYMSRQEVSWIPMAELDGLLLTSQSILGFS